jgi:hypothetical protein
MNNHVSEPFQTILNQFAHLDAQNPAHRDAQMTPEESAEYAAYLDAQREREDKLQGLASFLGEQITKLNAIAASLHTSDVPLEDACPRCACNPCKCNWTPEDNEDTAQRGWPGDGSGEDDLADMNANEADDYRNE